ncbi:hypothetical protein RCH14_004554 [Massilia sp. MP_M2]|uniref:hypothetical protein n=1 Tax=Massilia sp. MP_M2 TaxID=3071713 RepID=UPI00319E721C
MSKSTLNNAESGEEIDVGDEITVQLRGGKTLPATVTMLEPPDPTFGGCVHYRLADGKEDFCHAEDIGAQFCAPDGSPYRWDGINHDENAEGGWTREDTESMERGRDLPLTNDVGEYMP